MRFGELSDPSGQWLPLRTVSQSSLALRSPQALTDVINTLAPDHSPRYAPRDGLTWCATFVTDATDALQCIIPHWILNNGEPSGPGMVGAREQRANDFGEWLRVVGQRKGWREVFSEAEALALSAEGLPVVATWFNPLGGPGHVMLGAVGGWAQAGKVCYRKAPITSCLGPEKIRAVKYWAHS